MVAAGSEGDPGRFDRLLREEGLTPHWWSNEPGVRYAPHAHRYHKVLYCVAGSITFTLLPGGRAVALTPGRRLDLSPGTEHSAVVGPAGVTCVEGWRDPAVDRPAGPAV